MIKKIALAAILATGGAAAANAATIYASEVVSVTPTQTVGAGRGDPTSALGAPDGKFYSLGLGGSIVLGFDKLVSGLGYVTEVTYKLPDYLEYAKISTSLDGITWSTEVQAFNALAQAGEPIDAGTTPFKFIKITDVSPAAKGRDGFDLESVGFEEYVPAPVPLPAAGLMLLGGLAGMGGLALRRKKA